VRHRSTLALGWILAIGPSCVLQAEGTGGPAADGGAGAGSVNGPGGQGGSAGAGGSGNAGGSGGGPGLGPVSCGDGTACLIGDICCITDQTPDQVEEDCMTVAACDAAQGIVASCDGPEDCTNPGEHCCGQFTHPTYQSLMCGICDGSFSNPFMCHPSAGQCSNGKDCNSSMYLPPGYGYCTP
jgi:hypothetical protein